MALSCWTLSGCAEPAPQLAPLPPVIRTVTVYRALDKSLTTPCEEPMEDPASIQTDVDLMGSRMQWMTTSDCNARKLKAIDKLQGTGAKAADPPDASDLASKP